MLLKSRGLAFGRLKLKQLAPASEREPTRGDVATCLQSGLCMPHCVSEKATLIGQERCYEAVDASLRCVASINYKTYGTARIRYCCVLFPFQMGRTTRQHRYDRLLT